MKNYMRRALRLAERGRGRTAPNPMVGAVLVKHDVVVGEGYHQRAGEPHAEVLALRQAGEKARGATMYVTLEPCCHFGRTPPCTQAVIEAGVAQVHMAMLDPNPRVAGQGRAELEAAGIRTLLGEHEMEARVQNEVFMYWITQRTPFVIAKYAMSLDGKIATRTGASQWISGETARGYSHRLRNEVDAILVGANTVLKDDPQLTTRLPQSDIKHPLRVVLDSRGRIPHTARLFDPALPGKTLLATTPAISDKQANLLSDRGVEVLVLHAESTPALNSPSWVSLTALLEELGHRQISSLLVEGGATVLGSFFDHGLVNKVLAFLAPVIIGGHEAPGAVAGRGVAQMAQAIRLDRISVKHVGSDLLVTAYPIQKGEDNV